MIVIILVLLLIILSLFVLLRYYRIHIYSWFTNFPKPKYRVVLEKNVMVSMPDGTKLATDIYRPKTLDKFPVIIIRTPYHKTNYSHRFLAWLFASQGYVIIVQDVRGKYGSEGEFYPYAYEALDGHTTVTWAGEARWSNGKVALFGLSYSGSCAWLAARYKSPYLRTIISMFTTQNTYSIWIDRGIPFLKGPLLWLAKYCGKTENTGITDQSLEPTLWQLPVNELDVHATHCKILFYKEYLAHIQPDSFWEEISAHHNIGNLDISAYIVGGWYDPFLRGTIEDYQRMKQAPASSLNHYSRLVIGPWAHNPSQKFKGMELGKNANFQSMLVSILEWCDIWLKDRKSLIASHNNVRYFIMGRNEWKVSEQWPPDNIKEEKLYLSMENDSANPRKGFLLSTPPLHIQKNSYMYSPRDPVLFRGGYILREEGWIVPIEQDEIIARDDVLIYNSSPLQEECCIVGAIKLVLYISSQALDTDFCAKICDVYPFGKTFNLTPGFVRMRFRDSIENPQLIVPGTIYKVEISFRSIAHSFLKNHRIQLQITSSDFPVHNRNLNTGMSCETSVDIKEVEQTIYTGNSYGSHLILPILKEDN